jgi:predicted ATPase with chaperone activity
MIVSGLTPISLATPFDTPSAESSTTIRSRVLAARARATTRLACLGIAVNAHIPGREVRRLCRIDARGRRKVIALRGARSVLLSVGRGSYQYNVNVPLARGS